MTSISEAAQRHLCSQCGNSASLAADLIFCGCCAVPAYYTHDTHCVHRLLCCSVVCCLDLFVSRVMHEALLSSLLRAPMSFYHTTPTGRIINRLTKDTADIDRNLAGNLSFAFRYGVQYATRSPLSSSTATITSFMVHMLNAGQVAVSSMHRAFTNVITLLCSDKQELDTECPKLYAIRCLAAVTGHSCSLFPLSS